MSLSTGQILHNRYRIVKLLGMGGFGAVYRAWDTTFSIPCAVKENLDISPGAQRQFMREAKMLRTLKHPNLPLVTDYFVIPEQGQYLVMDYVEGEDLFTKLEEVNAPLTETQVLSWIEQICDALTYLHSQSPPIIHRDIKPANIRITPDGKATLVDFGIAKVYDSQLQTTAGARAVTPGYSPLEQYGQGTTDARTDIYAMGATLYHLLTGVKPPESVERVTGDTLETPAMLNPGLSPGTVAAIMGAMQIQPG
jgi:serine/threonine protein kinase